ncbi:class II fructose-1,6-bisphosphate aldolase [[Mycoplasma] testudinis]|uniref:class II fructose-1,6-bisphosphate aldolase n=1 Tax=[Mycoplasma] testudinis TaxID=33924 RepID=UPI000480362B|nr:class II fructose-1,6-bisphosphate aldolase [[Mycoplasma] testudinis]
MNHTTRLQNTKAMIEKAFKNNYAVPHININNLEWIKAALTAAQETKTPLILGVSEGAAKYMGGYKIAFHMVDDLMETLDITVPVALHLDHGSFDATFKAMDAGFTSVMFDGSHLPFEENFAKSKEVIANALKHNVSVEVEVGTIGGEEDGVIGSGELADPKDCIKLLSLGNITMLAAGFGNIHGIYPANWKGLNFERLQEIRKVTNMPLVLHGGSGIPNEQIQKAVNLGINKVNVNTECQLAFAEATRKYIEEKKDLDLHKKGYDPRKLLKPGTDAIKAMCIEKFTLFGAVGKA